MDKHENANEWTDADGGERPNNVTGKIRCAVKYLWKHLKVGLILQSLHIF